MNILLLVPFFTGSHARWAKEYAQYSQHKVHILSMTGHHWKWRMHMGAVILAKQVLAYKGAIDLILTTDMLDVATFAGLIRPKLPNVPIVTYFHENQLTYPWSPTDKDVKLKRDNHYSFINYTTALVSDAIFFNSLYHKTSFLTALPTFLKQFPDYHNIESVEAIAKKSKVLYLGLDVRKFDKYRPAKPKSIADPPLLIWNHRWEYDKNPIDFWETMVALKQQGLSFQIAALGQQFKKIPPSIKAAKENLSNNIIHWGYAENLETYASLLWKGDILPVTAYQDFFGGSVVEAMYCNCYPLLPKRLSYLEHIPQEKYFRHFYDTKYGFKQKIITFIKNLLNVRKNNTQSYVSQYDWSIMATQYDASFEKVYILKSS